MYYNNLSNYYRTQHSLHCLHPGLDRGGNQLGSQTFVTEETARGDIFMDEMEKEMIFMDVMRMEKIFLDVMEKEKILMEQTSHLEMPGKQKASIRVRPIEELQEAGPVKGRRRRGRWYELPEEEDQVNTTTRHQLTTTDNKHSLFANRLDFSYESSAL